MLSRYILELLPGHYLNDRTGLENVVFADGHSCLHVHRLDEVLAEVSVQIPIGIDLEEIVTGLEEALADERGLEVYVSDLSDKATIRVRAVARDAASADELERALRLRVHERLRGEGVLA